MQIEEIEVRPVSKPTHSRSLRLGGDWVGLFFFSKCIFIPLFYILISLVVGGEAGEHQCHLKNVTLFCKIQQLPWQRERLAGIILSFDKTTISGHVLKNR